MYIQIFSKFQELVSLVHNAVIFEAKNTLSGEIDGDITFSEWPISINSNIDLSTGIMTVQMDAMYSMSILASFKGSASIQMKQNGQVTNQWSAESSSVMTQMFSVQKRLSKGDLISFSVSSGTILATETYPFVFSGRAEI